MADSICVGHQPGLGWHSCSNQAICTTITSVAAWGSGDSKSQAASVVPGDSMQQVIAVCLPTNKDSREKSCSEL